MRLATPSVLAFTLLLAGCASAPQPKQLPLHAAPSSDSFVSKQLPTDAEKYSATGLDNTYFGVSGAKGSLAVGLLFGAIGTLGNIAHINAENKDSAKPLGALTSQNLAQLLREQISTPESAMSNAQSSYELVPSANLYFRSKTSYWLTCTITAHQTGSSWTARYAVALSGVHDSTDPGDTSKAIEALGPCLKSAYTLFAEHVDGQLNSFQSRTITTPKLDGKGNVDQTILIETSALPDRAIEKDSLGLIQLRKDQIKSIK